jgi:hypothetical protein
MTLLEELESIFEDIEHKRNQCIEDTKHVTHQDAALVMAGMQQGYSEALQVVRLRLNAYLLNELK